MMERASSEPKTAKPFEQHLKVKPIAITLLVVRTLIAVTYGDVLAISSPLDYQVIQRTTKDMGVIVIDGELTGFAGQPDSVEARITLEGNAGEWKRLESKVDRMKFQATMEAPAGGWYRVGVRALSAGNVLAETKIEHVGIGEVFVVAGQSNSANHGAEKQKTKTGLVAAFDGRKWQLANDPQPGASGGEGSFMPPFGDGIAEKLRVPVGIAAVGVGATSVREWLPKGATFPNPPTIEGNVQRLPDGGWESKGGIFAALVSRMTALGPHGFRAVLWHQGESDANQADATRTLPGNLYREYLEKVICGSRREAGWDAPWFVAQVSYHVPGDEASPDLRAAQASLWKDGIALEGPDSDALKGEFRENGGQGVHFSGPGLREHAARWVEKVAPWLEQEGVLNGSAGDKPLVDKTLVAWVAPANLTQRGGSVLTIEDRGGNFDAAVFGELTPGKWMAGSEMFRRTQKDQSAFAPETADTKTFVQIAMVYSGKTVTVFRDGRQYSQHTMTEAPEEFDAASIVSIGKRHRRQGDNARFAGAIDDARIYAQALSAEQLAALKPNVASEPKPWAWWSFDDAEAKDKTGRFLITQLIGGAKVEDGKLVLDGTTGDFFCKSGKEIPFTYETPARPVKVPENWLTYHLTHPGPGEAMPGDPNCAFFWKGRYHLHYIYTHRDGFSFAHVSSDDMVHWKWHPTTLTPPKTGHGMFSGTGFFTKEGRPAIIYHGEGSGRNQIAIAQDDALEKWSAPMPLEPIVRADQDGSKIANWDPDAWIDGGSYYALSGGSPGSGKPPTLFRSADLKSWDYLGLFLTKDMPDVQPTEDISCPNFFKIGKKDMLLCISHTLGCRYYLGEWKNEKFTPDFHGRMNWHAWDFFAPESVLTPDGRRVMWAWCKLDYPQSGIQSLPRELSLPDDGILRIKPLRELEKLRSEEKSESNISLKNDAPHRLREISGDALELDIRFVRGMATEFGVQVYCGDGDGGFPISFEPAAALLRLGELKVPFELKAGEPARLRVFLDKNMIEVFANDRQAAVASFRDAGPNLGIRLFSKGGDAVVTEVKSWKMKSIYPAD